MTSRAFLDTNILVYALARRTGVPDDPRTRIADNIISEGGTISVQVLNEFVDVVSRKHRKAWTEIREILEVIEDLFGPAIPLTGEIHRSAVGISFRYGFRIYDSLIVAAAEHAGCDKLYTEDLHHEQTIGKVKIVNPFL